MKKTFKLIVTMRSIAVTVLVAVIGFSIIACDNGGGGGGGGNTGGNTGGTVVRFNLTGAKAILGVSGSGSGRAARAVGAGNDLAKVLADNSIVSVLSGNQDVPPVDAILRSPVEGRKDIYILFKNRSFGYESENGNWVDMGTLIHVKEDGTVKGVFKDVFIGVENLNYLSFDLNGNLYYTRYVSSGIYDGYNEIYKYNPVTYKEERIIRLEMFRGGNVSLHNIQLSQDGNYVLAQSGDDDIGAGLRIIPVANPSAAYLIDKVGGKTVYVMYFGYNRQKNEIYFYGFVSDDDDDDRTGLGLHKLSSNSFSKDDWELTTLDTQSYNFMHTERIFFAPDNSVWWEGGFFQYANNNHGIAKLLNSSGQPDYKIPDVFSSGGGFFSFFSGQYAYFYASNGTNNIIYRARIDNPENAENLLTDPKLVAKLAKDDTSIWSFDVAGNDLYISGVENPVWDADGYLITEADFFSGKIDMSTPANTYTEFSGLGQVTAIVGY